MRMRMYVGVVQNVTLRMDALRQHEEMETNQVN